MQVGFSQVYFLPQKHNINIDHFLDVTLFVEKIKSTAFHESERERKGYTKVQYSSKMELTFIEIRNALKKNLISIEMSIFNDETIY